MGITATHIIINVGSFALLVLEFCRHFGLGASLGRKAPYGTYSARRMLFRSSFTLVMV